MTSEARQLYLDLALLSHGSVTSWSAGSGVPGSREPTGESRPPHELFAAEYERKGQSAVTHWRRELDRWRGFDVDRSQVREETREQRDKRICATGEGLSLKEAALKFRCAERDVITARLAAERHSATGRRLDLAGNDADKARILIDAGMSYRRAAEKLRTHTNTVVRWVKAA